LDPSWLSVNRVVANVGEVARGQEATFDFLVRAPETPGEYRETLGLLIDGLAWFGDVGGPPDDTIALALTVVAPPPEPGPEPAPEPEPEPADETEDLGDPSVEVDAESDTTGVPDSVGVPDTVEEPETTNRVPDTGVHQDSFVDLPSTPEAERTVAVRRDEGCGAGGSALTAVLALGGLLKLRGRWSRARRGNAARAR
jgi:hypothetical protein